VVIFRTEGAERLEPIESLVIDVPSEMLGAVMQLVGDRRAQLLKMHTSDARTHLSFTVPARGLIGLRGRMLTATQGEAIIHHRFQEFGAYRGDIPGRISGVMIAMATGRATAYAIEGLAGRGVLFVAPGDQVYGGQVVGEHCKPADITVNIVRQKRLNNIRSSNKEATVTLRAPRTLSLEAALEYIEEDELVELTPKAIRLRKRGLSELERKRQARTPALSSV
jgi:GTP-binding protein